MRSAPNQSRNREGWIDNCRSDGRGPDNRYRSGDHQIPSNKGGVRSESKAFQARVNIIGYKFQRERDLTQGELNEFLRGDPAGASVAPDGVDRALLLPYTKTLSPEDIVMGKVLIQILPQLSWESQSVVRTAQIRIIIIILLC